ncbi:hypothetical protein BDC45DRAFT_574210 [Circinella umbellata]|nr:hypothetical protein BDC45DRAFT_574210 [Circinella umbellata]
MTIFAGSKELRDFILNTLNLTMDRFVTKYHEELAEFSFKTTIATSKGQIRYDPVFWDKNLMELKELWDNSQTYRIQALRRMLGRVAETAVDWLQQSCSSSSNVEDQNDNDYEIADNADIIYADLDDVQKLIKIFICYIRSMQLPLDPVDAERTAFSTDKDGILLATLDRKTHLLILTKALKTLHHWHVKININETTSVKKSVKFLGHYISENSIDVDKSRIDAILAKQVAWWPSLQKDIIATTAECELCQTHKYPLCKAGELQSIPVGKAGEVWAMEIAVLPTSLKGN